MDMPPAASIWPYISSNYALLSITATITILIVTTMAVLRKYIRIIFNIIKDTPPPLSMGPRDFVRIEGEPVHFRALDGRSLSGMFLFGDGEHASKGMILFAHEFASDRYSCARYCRPLLDAGYDVFSFDFRGHGDSSSEEGYEPRQWATDRELNDMLGALAFVEDQLEAQGRPAEVGLFGISRGACAGILAAAQQTSIKALIVDGAFSTDTSLEYLMKRWAYIFAKVRFVYENHPPIFWRFMRWLLFRECRRKLNCVFPSVRKALMRMEPRPMLFIHGQRDSYIPVEQTRLLYESAGYPKYLWIVGVARHNQAAIVEPEHYAQRTVAFFDRYLTRMTHRNERGDRPAAEKPAETIMPFPKPARHPTAEGEQDASSASA